MSWTWWSGACARKSTIHSKRNSSRPFAALAMLSNRAEPRSIATQLVLLFTICATLLLSCGLGLFYWIVVRHAVEEDNAVLADKVAALRADLKQPDGLYAVDRELKSRRAGETAVYWIRIIQPGGAVDTETPGMSELLPPSVFPLTATPGSVARSEEHTSELQSQFHLVCRLLLE